MKALYQQIKQNQDVRKSLSQFREKIKSTGELEKAQALWKEDGQCLQELLRAEDAKTRKNAALLIGDLKRQDLLSALWSAYEKETTLFVKSAYLVAMENLDITDFKTSIKNRKEELESSIPKEEEAKHFYEELSALEGLYVKLFGRTRHTFTGDGNVYDILLLGNRRQLPALLEQLKAEETIQTYDAKVLSAGIRLPNAQIKTLQEIRTWSEMLFLVPGMKTVAADPMQAAEKILQSGLAEFLEKNHKEPGPFYFRVEYKSKQEGKEKNAFLKKLSTALEKGSKRNWICSPADYEWELRLVETKNGSLNAMVKLGTLEDTRFSYRKEYLPVSIKPVTAALLVELAKEYMAESAQVLDPFCGVGTMLIERQKRIPANTSYGLDTLGLAIEKAKENTEAAGQIVHFINRNFFDFTHEYLFDEIFTNMPFAQGKTTPLDIYQLYEKFWGKAAIHLVSGGKAILYTHNKEHGDKLAPLEGFSKLQEWTIHSKEGTYLQVWEKMK